MKEFWIKARGFEDQYEISSYGKIKSLGNNDTRKEKILKNSYTGYKRKYKAVCFRKDNINHRFYVHRLVAEYFVENPHGLNYVNHIDNDSLNNNFTNLEWVTMKENIKHAWDNGHCKPHGCGRKLSDRNVIEIKILIKFGITSRLISEYYNVSESAIGSIKAGRSFVNI